MMKYLQEIIYLLDKEVRKIPILIVFFLGASTLDFIGLALVGSYISLIVNQGLISDNALFGNIFTIILGGETPSILKIGLLLFIIFVLKAVIGIIINYVIIRFSQRQELRLRSYLMMAYQFLPYNEHIKRNSSEYIYSIQQLTSTYNSTLLTLLRLVGDSAIGIVILVLLAITSGKMLAILVLLLGLIIYLFDYFFKNRLNNYGLLVNKASTEMIKGVHEGIEGLKEIRILGRESFFHKKVKDAAYKANYYNRFKLVITTLPRYLLEVVIVGFIVLLVSITIFSEQEPKAIIAILGIFGVASMRLIPIANMLSNSLTNLRFNRNGIALLYKDVKNLTPVKPINNKIISSNNLTESFEVLTLKNVCFNHENSKQNIINRASFEIRAGDCVGVVGPSGSGKTTLIDLLLGLLKPQEGLILLNNKPLDEMLSMWRSQVAYLPQQVFLTDNSLKHNIALGIEDKDIDEKKLLGIINRAQLTDLVKELPSGIETIIGERGVRLSGGQRQRVALARAFYHGRNILVLDESTSSLDDETESEIVKEIQRLKGKVTMIIIAHRLSTIKHCDYIFRLDDGKITKQ